MQNPSKDYHEEFHKSLRQYLSGNIKFEDLHRHEDNDDVSKALYEKEKVLCWIMTSPKNLAVKARVVRDTWSRRCNKVLFMSSATNKKFPTIGLNVPEGRTHLTAKTMQAFSHIYKNHFDDADWFMKADDDSYVVLENLRFFLTSQNKSKPVFFGHHLKAFVKEGYSQGGAGYVLSKEALRRYGKKGHDSKLCRRDGGPEDVEFGRCMAKLGVKKVNTTDALGRSRFHPLQPESYFDQNGAKKVLTPTTNQELTPATNQELTTTTNQILTPTTNQELTPTTSQELTPTTNQKLAPSTSQEMTPTTNQELAPTTNQEVTPTTNQEMTPTTKQELTPTINQEMTPTTNQELTPAT
ncbi:glycoprotein-N-acetylgalactosamine 3-beta-galactosyltransferase 1-like [Haliotis asinina]|uniref:glycoprotein-N-acetylgalactosamine 3-beta-galactosyltransferase 1-like n=1 Tax=Haliotis asinina TaxID=109174 RepID=UPI0035320094